MTNDRATELASEWTIESKQQEQEEAAAAEEEQSDSYWNLSPTTKSPAQICQEALAVNERVSRLKTGLKCELDSIFSGPDSSRSGQDWTGQDR